ncbi:hypothetical protein MGG_15314 [Pyricularia oryzae 70-15]|uniref:Uncharacterized protein n=1 Tax=Pyricularia oryzae (strain 70-15 / ATCC MYA-4617 / FGSC 8958) TaxID=242507 RepID=G4MQS6_PYRO7|nr:uncharacterized protein MGG_15314 [Pyricularia oryzae 70-15]EHA58157.1 hypothetical protein MGG_15314 [Pyricularia oryzae 70-15]
MPKCRRCYLGVDKNDQGLGKHQLSESFFFWTSTTTSLNVMMQMFRGRGGKLLSHRDILLGQWRRRALATQLSSEEFGPEHLPTTCLVRAEFSDISPSAYEYFSYQCSD